MNYINKFCRFIEHGTGETGFVIKIVEFDCATIQPPDLTLLWAIVVFDGSGATGCISLDTFDFLFQP